MTPDTDTLMENLKNEGFNFVCVDTDEPGKTYPPHTDQGDTALIILEGEMTFTMDNASRILHPLDRMDIPSGKLHEAVTGKEGCRYVYGAKSAKLIK